MVASRIFVLFVFIISNNSWSLNVAQSQRMYYDKEEKCIRRFYNAESFVCVCNATYCDDLNLDLSLRHRKYVLVTSSKDDQRFSVREGLFSNFSEKPSGGTRILSDNVIRIKVERSKKYQPIHGFGAAFTDSSGINILSLSDSAQTKLLKSYFSAEGLEYNMGRVPIGGTDFSTRGYSYQEKESDNFTLAMEDFIYKIALIKRSASLNNAPLKLVASVWSPPTWMKTNGDYYGTSFLKMKYYQSYADYIKKFFDEYAKQGVNFWCVTTGNEPLNGIYPFTKISSLGWTPHLQRRWIANNLGPTLRNSSHRDIRILAIDDQRLVLPWWLDRIMEDWRSAQYIDGVAVHWYWDFIISANVLDNIRNKYPNLTLISTEASYGDKPWDVHKVLLGSWLRAESYAQDIIENLNHWVGGWIDWNMALNANGGPNWVKNFVDSPIIVNATSDEFYRQPMFYALAHFTKFISPNSTRIGHVLSRVSSAVHFVTCETPDNRIVVVMLNRLSRDLRIEVEDGDRGIASIIVPANSINTFVYQ